MGRDLAWFPIRLRQLRRNSVRTRVLSHLVLPLLLLAEPVDWVRASDKSATPGALAEARLTRTEGITAESPVRDPLELNATRDCCDGGGLYGGADFLLVRPHFSEAIGFVRVSTAVVGSSLEMRTEAVDLEFGYEASLRAFVGYRLEESAGEFQFTFWHLRGDASADGTVESAAEFIVDPFGAVMGQAVDTKAEVDTNVYDMEFSRRILWRDPCWAIKWSAGVRIADVDQSYESTMMDSAGSRLSKGDFAASFIGAGPLLGLGVQRSFGDAGGVSLFAQGKGGLLVGDYDVKSAIQVPGFVGSQESSVTRTIPVTEVEFGLSWQICESLTVSAGWLFQAWFDLGASGGKFGDKFLPADDANIMSFDGLVLRAELRF